jgi:RNA polymerase sigma-70 factor, ECF subfamily
VPLCAILCEPPVSRTPGDRRQTLQLATREVKTHTPEFSRIFEEYHGLVFRTAYRITGNAADAEDVLQTIFLRLLRRGSSVPPIEKQESYFRRAAVNASLDLLRTRQSEPRMPLPELLAKEQSSPCELRECLRRAFVSLSPRAAEIFTLRYIENFTNQEIAKTMNISQVLVAVTVHRARRQLQKEIRTYFGGRL